MFGYKIFILKLMSIDGNTSTTITLQSKTEIIRITQKYGTGLSIIIVIKGIYMIVEVEIFRVTGIEPGANRRIFVDVFLQK